MSETSGKKSVGGSSSPQSDRMTLYLSMMTNSGFFNDVENQRGRSRMGLFDMKKITGIHRHEHFIEVDFQETKEFRHNLMKEQEPRPVEDSSIQNELIKIAISLKDSLPLYLKTILPHLHLHEGIFMKLVKQLQHKPVMAWFMPMNECRPRLTKTILTKSILNIIGYNIQDAPTDLMVYRQLSFGFLDDSCTRDVLLSFLNHFKKFVAAELEQDLPKETIVRESHKTIINIVDGQLKAFQLELEIWNPEPFAIFIEVKKIMDQTQLQRKEQILAEKLERKESNSPKVHKICSFESEPSNIPENSVQIKNNPPSKPKEESAQIKQKDIRHDN